VLVWGILAMGSKTNLDVDKLVTFGQMALEQGWYAQELDGRPSCLNDEPAPT